MSEKGFQKVDAFFHRRWNEVKEYIDYNPDWERPKAPLNVVSLKVDQRGLVSKREIPEHPTSLDGAVYHPDVVGLEPGKVVRTMDDHGRRLLFVGTRLGPALVYDNGGARVVYHKRLGSTQLMPVVFITSSEIAIANVLGGNVFDHSGNGIMYSNIGEKLEITYRLMTEPDFNPDLW